MAWSDIDWDGDMMDAATGLAAIAEIHTAIKERAEVTVHAIRLTDYADDFSGDVWLCEPPTTPGSRQFLKTILEDFYSSVESLIDGDDTVRFTTTSGGDTLWTIEDMVTDIAMGEFADLLTGPHDYRPFLWLREALDRLIYVRKMRGRIRWNLDAETYVSTFNVKQQDIDPFNPTETGWTNQEMWTATIAQPTVTDSSENLPGASSGFSGPFARWAFPLLDLRASGTGTSRLFHIEWFDDVALPEMPGLLGVVTRGQWIVQTQSASSPNPGLEVYASIDGSSPQNIYRYNPFNTSAGITLIEAGLSDIPRNDAREDISGSFSPIPVTYPFSTTPAHVYWWLYGAYVHLDISAELTDQTI